MTMVAGLGDEVVAFLVALVAGGVLLLAWMSTNVRERPRVEAVLVQQLRPGVVVAEEISRDDARLAGFEEPQAEQEDVQRENESASVENSPTNGTRSEDPCEEEAAAATASTATVSDSGETAATPGPEPSASAESDERAVKIRIKYLDDSQREVQARLTDKLGGFKRVHFAGDMSDDRTVRLIFNGHVLNADSQTLEQCGLYDNCVVHCLVSAPRQREAPRANGGNAANVGGGDLGGHDGLVEDDDLDLSHICYPLLGCVLVVIWWLQVVYPHYFSFMSTGSLVSLTVLFLASVVNTYMY